MRRHSRSTSWLVLAAVVCVPAAPRAQTQFAAEPVLAGAPSTLLGRCVAGDFDGDGDQDLFAQTIAVTPYTPFVLLRNDGRGRLTNTTASSLPPLPPNNVFGAIAITVLDIDGDGDLDVFAGNNAGAGASAMLLCNGGGAVFADASGNLPPGLSGIVDALGDDLDGDGDVDLVVIASIFGAAQQLVLVNDGSGTFSAGPVLGTALAGRIAAADIDGDGDRDLAIGQLPGLRLLRNDGGIVFTDVTSLQLPPLPGNHARSPSFGDVDGDGQPDLVVTSGVGPDDLVLRNSGGTFTVLATLPTAGTGAAALADVDDDGDLDLLRADVTGHLRLAIQGGGTFVAAPGRLPVVPTVVPSLLVADLDGDADPDLLVTNYLVGGSSVLRNRHRHLAAGAALRGQTWHVELWSTPGYAVLDHTSRLAIGLARLPQPLAVPGFGRLWLDLSGPLLVADAVVTAAAGVHTHAFAIPPGPALVGVELHLQAVLEQAPAPAHLTGFDSAVIR